MQATYGNYDHDDEPVSITEFADVAEKTNGKVTKIVRRIAIEWTVYAATQAALTTKIIAAYNAYTFHGKNFVLKQDDGNFSAHVLKIGGVTQD